MSDGAEPARGSSAGAAEAALAFRMGPIARVLVAEASGAATSMGGLTERLAQHLRRPDDAAQFHWRMLAAIGGRKSAPGGT